MHDFGRSGTLPRLITPDCLWTGRCIPSSVPGLHAHYAFYVLRGRDKVVLVDTGHPMHWEEVRADVEAFLQGRPVDYVFPTHSELPHSGLLRAWLERYPDAVAVGDMRDWPLYQPDLAHRFRQMEAGESLDLGDRRLVFLPPVWRDLPDTLWAFDTRDGILFLSDACAYFHAHVPGQCDHLSSEIAPPDVAIMRDFNDKALHWPKFTDSRPSFPEFDELMARLRPRLLAGAHGCVVDTPAETLPRFKQGILPASLGA
jgi:flavorubredoxin